MAAPVLSLSEQRSSLSGKKKKKKCIKNVLGIPTNLKIETHVIEAKQAESLCKILERLLPPARLPVRQNPKFSKDKTVNDPPEDSDKIKDAKNKRNQLSLGVNSLNKSIKKDLISAALLASDIQPKLLINHLNLLCSHNKVPFLHMPGLRDVTKDCLGFPCIALGFKKNCDFTEVVEEIKKFSQMRQSVKSKNEAIKVENNIVSSDSEEDTEDDVPEQSQTKEEETPFCYLYRSSKKERVFIPEEHGDRLQKKSDSEFISIKKDDEADDDVEELPQAGISSSLIRKKSKLMRLEDLDKSRSSLDEEELEELPKKKKKDWVIDKVGTKQNFKYCSANVMKAHSNPDRISRKWK